MTKVVLGGGLSGLSATYYLLKKLPGQQLTLVESSNRLGGWIKSNILNDGVIFEQGPRTIRPHGEAGLNTLNLLDDLELGDKVVPISSSHPAATKRMLYANGQLHYLPSTITSLFKKQAPFSKPFLSYLVKDVYAMKKTVEDEPIYDFVNRRFGQEFADYIISPLLCGVCAGNAKEISVKFLMKKLFEYEQMFGSMSAGLVRNFFNKQEKPVLNGLSLRARREGWSIYSLTNGLEMLPKSLENHIKLKDVRIQLDTKCEQLETSEKGAKLYLDNGQTLTCDNVISSIPASNLAYIVQNQHPQLSEKLRKIKSVSVGVVNLEYSGNLISEQAFGFLVPPKENLPILGVIYDSCCFPRNNNTVFTIMMGGYWFEQQFGKNPEEIVLLNTAKEQLGKILGITEEPVRFNVNILRNCIPQYVVGHEKNLEEINQYISENKVPIALCGASYHGVGINDVILSAKKAVQNL